MGLRTASVRHPHAEVMAPALTETNQTQTFKLPPDEQSASPINATAKQQQHGEAVYIAREAATCKSLPLANGTAPPSDAAATASREPPLNGDHPHNRTAMSGDRPPSMADRDTMGLRKINLDDVSDLLKADDDPNDTIFDNLPADEADMMQVFKGMADDADGVDLFGVDVLNMSIDEEQTDARDQRIQTLFDEAGALQVKLERQLDFLLRRIRKFQMRLMGQHVSGEVAGVFENVCRNIKRYAADQKAGDNSETAESSATSVLEVPVDMKPLTSTGTKNLVKKLELSNAMLANAAFRARMKKLTPAAAAEPFRQPQGQVVAMPKWMLREKKELQSVSGMLESEFRLVQEEVDSEATASSSGAESCDDTETYNNPHQQHLAIHKRAAWRYATDRAAIGAKWTWLQSQIADLEYKIRQYTDLHRKMRAGKDPVKLGGVSPPYQPSEYSPPPNCLNGYRGQLPGASIRNGESAPTAAGGVKDYQCARTRPLVNFRKRKLMHVAGLHAVSKKAERPATMRCGCTPPTLSCALCTGRVDPTQPRDHPEYLSRNEYMGLLDPSYHPVFSLNESVSASLHMEGIMNTQDWKQWSVRSNVKTMPKVKGERSESSAGNMKEPTGPGRPRKSNEHRKKNNRLIKPSTANALTAKIKNRARSKKSSRSGSLSNRSRKRSRKPSGQSIGSNGNDDEMDIHGGKFDSSGEPHQTVSNLNKRTRADSYDIDNIIIPFSVAATVRVEKLPYKEILTPKWRRIAEDDSTTKHGVKNNGVVITSQDTTTDKESFEDLSDAAVLTRHEKSEQDERKKFLSYLKLPIGYGRSRANRRTDSRAESSGANTPDPMSPAPIANFDSTLINAVVEKPEKETSRPATPKIDEHWPPSSARRRTISSTPDIPSVPPYEKRAFPLSDDSYQRMLRRMQMQQITYSKRSEDLHEPQVASPATPAASTLSDVAMPRRDVASAGTAQQDHDSESTESAFGDDDPDPTDPEWEAERTDFNR